jgi:hypothetical protein
MVTIHATNSKNMTQLVPEQHGAAGIARRAHNMVTLRSLDRNEVLLLSFFLFLYTGYQTWVVESDFVVSI